MRPRPLIAGVGAVIVVAVACGSPSSGKTAEELYGEHCLRCHAADGHGDPRRVGLSPGVDLRHSRALAAHERGVVYQRIANGYGEMPGFSHKLERGDIELLRDYCLQRFGGS